MMSSEEFKCVFCKDSFYDKETLQIHFRKHGDKNFHLQKSRFKDDPPVVPDKPVSNKDQAEMVECDVCPEVFTSISKAITHKHKLHPDHDAKYFCPWCGKLFTMKHLYNKHIQTAHADDEKIDRSFHCDACDVEFNVPNAVSYHNKFFHRIHDMPIIGNSKKLKMISQEAVQIYYCPFCGEEYDNKINLHKHMADDHSDENQNPDDVLRCPVCDAIFYHLDAYELHLTYHCVDDLYSEQSEIMDEITDFSLETVPPIAEKVESLKPKGEEEPMGIEQLFELTMDDSKQRKKKHKKHKKSKKSAITLDQFLTMNTDVFGEGLDFQGVEEVQSQTIAKRLKRPIKKPAQSKLPPGIEKLRRQGIVIKKKAGTTTAKPIVDKIGNNTLVPVVKTKPSTLATPNDLLTKLINQNNSEIKIVKKSSLEIKTTNDDTNETKHANLNVEDKLPVENAKPEETKSSFSNGNNNGVTEDHAKEILDQEITCNSKNNDDTYPYNTTRKSPKTENKSCNDSERDEVGSNHSQSILDEIDETADISQTGQETNVLDKLTALRNNSNIVIKSNQQCIPNINKNKETIISHDTNENTSCNEDDTDLDMNEDCNKNDTLNAVKHLSHLVVTPFSQEKKQLSKHDTSNTDKRVEQSTEVSKIAHLIRDVPAKMLPNTVKNPSSGITQSNAQLKLKPSESTSEESNLDVEDEIEHSDNTRIESAQTAKLASILNNPHLNIQTIKKPPKLPTQKESPIESLLKSEVSSADLLKLLTNVTAKPISVNKTLNTSASSPQISQYNIRNKPASPAPLKKDEVIEIYNIDDSDSDEANSNTAQINKPENKETLPQNKSADVLKNLNRNITIKSVNNHKVSNKAQVKEFDNDDDESPITTMPNNTRNSKLSSPQINQKQSALNNVLKNLSKNITVKSGNTSPGHFMMPQDQNSRDSSFAQDEGTDSETDSISGRVKITEMEGASDEEFHKEHTDVSDNLPQDNVKVQYPDDSHSGNEDKNDNDELDVDFSDEDVEAHIAANAVKKYPISNPNIDNLKNVCKDLVIKPSGQTINRTSQPSTDDIPPFAKSLSNRISITNMKQTDNCNKQIKPNNSNFRNAQPSGHSMKSTMQQNMASSSNQVNTVNKEVKTVKTFQTQTQTKTVIQEITTTVTKTIKTVNQNMKQEIRHTGQSCSMPKKIQHINANSNNFQGVKVRQTTPIASAGPRVRNPMRPTRPILTAPIRASNQLVPVRPKFNSPRQCSPRMPFVRPSASGQIRPQIGAQVKLAPGVSSTMNKRPNSESGPGHFSCFKKQKESLFPEADFAAMNQHEGESSVQFSSAMQMSKSNFASTTKTVKGNSVVTSTQMKSEMSANSQQLGKLRNLSGLSIVKTSQANQSQVEEKSEVSTAKQNTLDAIQKLQSQGLLVKKPRLVSEESEHSNPGSDDMEHFTDDEFGS